MFVVIFQILTRLITMLEIQNGYLIHESRQTIGINDHIVRLVKANLFGSVVGSLYYRNMNNTNSSHE